MRRASAFLLLALLTAGCAAPELAPPSPSPSPSPIPSPTPSPSPTPTVTTSSPPQPTTLAAENGTLSPTEIPAGETILVRFLLNATDRVRVNLVFEELRRPAPYGWSAQVSLRGPDGRLVADSGTSMPESGAAFTLVLRDLDRRAEDGPGEFLARVHASHPATLSAQAYVDAAAGPA